jgi:CheY-like chemotaxis protein
VGDGARLRQILVNLLGNAIKFTEEGEILVELAATREPGSNDAAGDGAVILHFRVQDTGIGIPPERTDRLFQSFSQVDGSISRRYGGTGLGLAISQRLVELMGGQIWVESAPGAGSTFHFTIRTGALALLDADAQFDVAVLDLHMPAMNGLQLGAALRKRARRQLPLVILASVGSRSLRAEAGALGQVLLVTKPVKQSQLQEILTKALAGQPLIEAQRVASTPFDSTFAACYPRRILLAEDNVVNQKVAVKILARLGYTVDVAANGQEAVVAVQRQPYDVVLMDMHMPEMDGLEATRTIRETLPPERQPAIIAMTAAATLEERQACQVAGMDAFVSKPVQLEQLTIALAETVGGAAAGD